jgi:lysophospholipase L1-like esterase
MAAGVRIRLGTDTRHLSWRVVLLGETPADDVSAFDLVVDGQLFASVSMDEKQKVTFRDLPPGRKQVELWLPQFGEIGLVDVVVDPDSSLFRPTQLDQPRFLVYGSSITGCKTASSPTRTWPAVVATELGLDLTCLGFGGECHLDQMVARLMRDLPADLIFMCLGTNVYGAGTFNRRSWLPALLGFVATVRDGHPQIPIVVMSPISSSSRENEQGPGQLTLAEVRAAVGDAVALLQRHGDEDVYHVDGPDILGLSERNLLFDGLHPGPEGYEHIASRLSQRLADLGIVPVSRKVG